MADKINTNVFDAEKKFVDFAGLDYFWGKAKTYIDGVDDTMSAKVVTLEDKVGDSTKGLVKDVKSIQAELESLSGGVGSIATQINNAIAELDVEDTAVTGQYVSSVSEVDGKIAVTRVALPDYTADFAAKADASDLNTHTGDTVAHITADERTAWNTAEQNAKDYADGKFQVAGNYEIAGAAAAVQGNLDAHTGDATAHITADERTAWNAAKASIDAFLKDADMTEKAVDTLAELQTYMTTDGEAAAKVVERIANLEAIDHDAYKAADTALETSLKSYADQAEADALTAAKTYADGLIMTDGVAKFEAAGAAATAKSEAIAAAAADATSKANAAQAAAEATPAAAATTKANAAQAAAEATAASLYQPKGDYEAAGTADSKIAALKLAETYEAKGAAADAQAAAIAQAKLDAAEALKGYYTKTEVDNLLSTNSTGDRAYAKQYTDELFSSIQFAANSDIDVLFTPKA